MPSPCGLLQRNRCAKEIKLFNILIFDYPSLFFYIVGIYYYTFLVMTYLATFIMKGKKSYMFYWPGCDVTIRGTTPTHCDKYTKVTLLADFRNSLHQTMGLLRNNSADLIGGYKTTTVKITYNCNHCTMY